MKQLAICLFLWTLGAQGVRAQEESAPDSEEQKKQETVLPEGQVKVAKVIDTESPNGCERPPVKFFRWTRMAIRPVDEPIQSFDDLRDRILAPNREDGKEVFNKPWQLTAITAWGMTPAELRVMYLAALQGDQANFKRELVQPCTILNDMIYDRDPPVALGKHLLADWEDRQPKWAWTWETNGKKSYFFEGCANPAYAVLMPTISAPAVTAAAPPPPPPPPPVPAAPAEAGAVAEARIIVPENIRVTIEGELRLVHQGLPAVTAAAAGAGAVAAIECPNFDPRTGASLFSRLPTGLLLRPEKWPEFLGSGAVGAAISYAVSDKGARHQAALQGGLLSLGLNVVANAINPQHDRAKLLVDDHRRTYPRGHDASFGDGKGGITWQGRRATIYVARPDGQKIPCQFLNIGRQTNFTPWVSQRKVITREVTRTVVQQECFTLVNGERKPCGSSIPP